MNIFDLKTEAPQTEMLVNIKAQHKTPKARHAALLENYDRAMAQAIQKDRASGFGTSQVLGANTYTGAIITNFLVDGSVTDLVNQLAFLDAYSLTHDADFYKPLSVGQLKHVTGSEACQVASTSPATFEPATGSTVTAIQITPNYFSQPARVGANDLNSGLRMENLRAKAIASFADTVTQYATAPITAATFTATPTIISPGAFGLSELATLQGQLQKSPIKNLILDGTYLARVANQPGFYQRTGEGLNDAKGYKPYGWDVLAPASNWTGAGANIKGFACNPQAIVRVTGLPLNPPSPTLLSETFELPGLSIAVQWNMWLSLATRTMMMSYDLIAGFAAADTTAGVIIASGTPG